METFVEFVSIGGTCFHKIRKVGQDEYIVEQQQTESAPDSINLITQIDIQLSINEGIEITYIQQILGFNGVTAFATGEFTIDGLGSCLPINGIAPNLDCTEFLRAVCRHFNLFLDVDQLTGVADLAPRNQYHKGQPIALPLDGRMAVAKSTVQIASTPGTIQLNYAREDGEALYVERAYDYNVSLGQGYLDASETRESLFAATGPRSYLLPTQGISLTLPTLNTQDEFAKVLGALGRGDEAIKYSYLPRILRWLGLQTVSEATEGLWVNATEFTGNYPAPGGGLIYPLASFEDGYNGNLDYPTLYDLWFDKSLQLSASLLRVTGNVLLYPNEINKLNARSVVALEGHLYAVESIEFVPSGSQIASITLIRLQ
jgi:hypothetical protein